jgi:hypothetical protein
MVEGEYGANIVYVNGKMISAEIIPWMEGGEDEVQWWKGWIQVWYIWYIVTAFVNATMYPHPAQF